jgi:putative Mg2+ transporter-C (MgtC) family protein
MFPIDLYEFNETTAMIRLLLALLFSAILGMERTRKLRPAGMRTYMLVCIGACSTMLGGLYLYEIYGPGFDPARMAAQVISGIGFIGAGTIMVTPRQKVKGLTTAAGLWAVACLGINIGVGNYIIAFGVFVAMLITMFLADKLEVLLFRRLMRIHVTILIQSLDVIPHIREALKPLNITLSDLEFSYSVEKQGVAMTCFLRLKHWTHHQNAVKILESIPGVFHIELLDI